MNHNNTSSIKQLIEEAKEKYKSLPIKNEEVVPTEDWQIPEAISIFTDFAAVDRSKKSIIKEPDDKKLYVKKNKNGKVDLSNPERLFIDELEKTDDEVQWWFENSYGESKYFSIAYKKANGHYYGFYPDFIIKSKKETLIVEIKDNKDFKPENTLKLQAGKDYLKRYDHKEKVRFYIISPDDYFSFFKMLKEQELDKFKSIYEEKLIRNNRSQQLVIQSKEEKTEKDNEILELFEELDKTINELKDEKLKRELLQLSLEEAEQNIRIFSKALSEQKPQKDIGIKIKIEKPFNICVLGEVSDKDLVVQELQKYFTKLQVNTNDWDIKFFSNAKLQNTDVLRTLVKGQSRFNLIITGQIHHHSGKGNKKANIISELENPKYIPHKIGSNPKDILTPDKVLKAVDEFLTG